MLSIEHLSIEFASRPILDDISLLVNRRERIALVGKNGAGKTTLLRLIAGEYQPTSGRISRETDMTIGYLPQVMLHQDGCTLREDVMSVFAHEDESEQARRIAEMDRTIIGLGFERRDFDRQLSEFSGGWRMRIELAKILLRHPDLLLLDEPTNHLDIESIQWLEDFLRQSPSAVLLVSHDRAFIDNVTTRTIEITLGRIYDYNVPYSQFVTLRQERHEQQVRAYMNQQKMIHDTEEFIERFRYKATKAVQVQSRIKQLERLERLEVDLEDTARLNLRFPPAPRSGDFPLIVEDLRKDFGEHNVFHDVTFTIRRGEKVAFVGKNGEGKTTLVRCIMNQLDYLGTLKIGHNVKIGYFAQNQAALLDENLTVFETIDYVAVGDIRTKIRDILGAFMFGGEASDKKVKVLSGGERSRLAMIRLLLEPCNLLILDEPTNHLDMPSKDVLKAALKDFNGTVICVSHDRDFLDGLVEKVYEFGGGRVREHLGGIYDFLRHKKIDSLQELEKKNPSTPINPAIQNTPTSSKLDYAAQKAEAAARRKKEKQIAETETEITRLEAQQAEIEALLNLPENQTAELFQKYESVKHQIEQKMYEWELLNEA
ncbi:MAG: ABC-F family ATP-binding cassette domain-containing protein [Paludibacteraceae bacterium]|jgi:ATP-binding cassette subfamily F protein 3|nr:ABC-F family ATP-binding cassette domain-containing protein [Paludibacteraceae bacterium]MBR6115917.1 ABC-F family ATP-binding cassette domain-containing protein [Paludibacteraceae bacterium]